jgi:S-(hydroxymethyl)glutathione dehydrogenase/alcohol dehydrogenase
LTGIRTDHHKGDCVKTRAAICWELNGDWSVEEVELDDPKPGEVLVEIAYAGLCHSDEHVRLGDFSAPDLGILPNLPMCGGHEGAGVVVAVGEGVTRVAVGDHVSTSFIPACGVCPPCATGHQNLCDLGALIMGGGGMVADGAWRMHAKGQDVVTMAQLGTFAEHMVANEASVVKVEKHLPMDAVALVSCGVATGWGSAVYRGGVKAGDTVVVVGCGGIGINAVQGAKHAGATQIVAVDPVALKREYAQQLGATHAAASIEEATAMVGEISWGRMANVVILTPATLTGDFIMAGLGMTAKGGTCVATAIAPMAQFDAQISLLDLAMSEKALLGTVFGSCNPRADIPKLLRMYEQGQLELDSLITGRYSLDDINQGYADLHAGKNMRGVLAINA